MLHAFDVEAGLVLAHVDIAEKSNEIPAAQQLLGELHVAHSIVPLDAMHCQKQPYVDGPGSGKCYFPCFCSATGERRQSRPKPFGRSTAWSSST